VKANDLIPFKTKDTLRPVKLLSYKIEMATFTNSTPALTDCRWIATFKSVMAPCYKRGDNHAGRDDGLFNNVRHADPPDKGILANSSALPHTLGSACIHSVY
jgi:hypothetical protein